MIEQPPPELRGAAATGRRATDRGVETSSLREVRRVRLFEAVLAASVLLVGCADEPPPVDDQPYSTVADVAQLMSTILEPAADHYWDAVGWIDEPSGTTEIVPRTEEEWVTVRNAAFVIAESGNLLMMPERVRDDPAWIPMSQALVDVGRKAIEVAEFREPLEVFNVGAEIYYVCTNCHAHFALETLPPADERVGPGAP